MARPVSRITIVPDGKLFYLPFEALMRSGPSAASGFRNSGAPGGRFFIEDYEVSYAPSASTLIAIQERPRRPPGSLEFLGVASSLKHDRRPIAFPQAGQLPPLEFAEREIETAASCFPKDKVRLLSGESATESDFLELPLDQFRIIHFATHGLYDDQNWLRSCLLLEQDSRGEHDGFLQPFDIYQLDLNAELVVLSACDLGLGRLEKGEGLFGMALAFFYAGARSFLCSLWSVDDQDSVLFMKTFYDRLHAGWTPGRALRQAKLEMMGPRGRAPYFWAGFVLF
jgi:CHAT domain-containing protein